MRTVQACNLILWLHPLSNQILKRHVTSPDQGLSSSEERRGKSLGTRLLKMLELDVQCQTSLRAPSFEVTDRAEKNNVRGLALGVKRPPLMCELLFKALS